MKPLRVYANRDGMIPSSEVTLHLYFTKERKREAEERAQALRATRIRRYTRATYGFLIVSIGYVLGHLFAAYLRGTL